MFLVVIKDSTFRDVLANSGKEDLFKQKCWKKIFKNYWVVLRVPICIALFTA